MRMLLCCVWALALYPILDVVYPMEGVPRSLALVATGLYLALSWAVTGVVYVGRVLVRTKGRRPILTVAALAVSVLLGALYGVLVGELPVAYWVVSCGALGLVVQYTTYVDLGAFSNVYAYVVVSILYVACELVGWLYGCGTSTVAKVVLYWAFCVVYAVLANRTHLESVVERRSQNLGSLPKHTYRYNAALTVLLCCVPLPLLLLSGRLGDAAYGLLASAGRGALYAFKALSGALAKDSEAVESVVEDEPAAQYQPYYEESSSAVWDSLWVLGAAFLAYLAYRYHESALRWLKELVQTLRSTLYRTFVRDSAPRRDLPPEGDYVDYVRDLPKGYSRRDFRRDLHAYLRMETSTEALRFGYATLVHGLNVLHYGVQPSDTLTDVSTKYDCGGFPVGYSQTLYGGTPPTEGERAELDALLRGVYGELRRHR